MKWILKSDLFLYQFLSNSNSVNGVFRFDNKTYKFVEGFQNNWKIFSRLYYSMATCRRAPENFIQETLKDEICGWRIRQFESQWISLLDRSQKSLNRCLKIIITIFISNNIKYILHETYNLKRNGVINDHLNIFLLKYLIIFALPFCHLSLSNLLCN